MTNRYTLRFSGEIFIFGDSLEEAQKATQEFLNGSEGHVKIDSLVLDTEAYDPGRD